MTVCMQGLATVFVENENTLAIVKYLTNTTELPTFVGTQLTQMVVDFYPGEVYMSQSYRTFTAAGTQG